MVAHSGKGGRMTYDRQNAGAAALEFARELNGRPYIYGGTWPQSGIIAIPAASAEARAASSWSTPATRA